MLTLLDIVNQGQARVSEGQHCSVRVRHRGGGTQLNKLFTVNLQDWNTFWIEGRCAL